MDTTSSGGRLKVRFSGQLVSGLQWQRGVKTAVIMVLAFLAGMLPLPGMDEAARRCLIIFVAAALLWMTEVISPFATSVMVVVSCIYALGQPGGALQLEGTGLTDSYRIFLNPIASPVLILFFAGFVMAVAATKHGFDVTLAHLFVRPFGRRPRRVLLGVILTTALFSMFMSNTATTAMMIAMLTPILAQCEDRRGLQKALVLAVPFAANIGGMGTIIGTPPNAVAASVLLTHGHQVTFARWMVVGTPIVVIMLFVLWLVLIGLFRPIKDELKIDFSEPITVTWGLIVVVLTFTVTVCLWLTEGWHGISAPVVSLVPVGVFAGLRIIEPGDLKKIDWDIIVLVAGGLCLGVAMKRTGLSDVLVSMIPYGDLPMLLVVFGIAATTLILSNFMSHTAASNLMIPIVISMSQVVSPVVGALAVALTSSLAMSLPISTPPNAIAFATRVIRTKDMARYGTMVSVCGLALLMLMFILFSTRLESQFPLHEQLAWFG